MSKRRKNRLGELAPGRKVRPAKFGTSIRQFEKQFKAHFGPNHSPHPLFAAPVLQLTKAEIHKMLRDGAANLRVGEVLTRSDVDVQSQTGLMLMRLGIYSALKAVLAFCNQNMDLRSMHDLEGVARHAQHLADLTRGIQAPYLLKAPPRGKPDPLEKIHHKAKCVVARDWLQMCCGFPANEAVALVLQRVKGLKKPTLEGWGKPASRDKINDEIESQWASLLNIAEMAVRHGDNDIRVVLDRFLNVTRPKGEAVPPNWAGLGGLGRIDDIAQAKA